MEFPHFFNTLCTFWRNSILFQCLESRVHISMLFQYFYRTSPVRGNPEQRIESLVPHSTDVADRKFTPAAPNPPAVSVPRATALFVRTPDRSRSATQAGVGALHTTPQYIFHRFILSPHAFPLAIFMHRTVANLLLATVYPTNQHCNICFRYTQLVEFDLSKSFQQHMCLAVWINLCRFLKRKCFRIGSPRYQLIDFSTTNTVRLVYYWSLYGPTGPTTGAVNPRHLPGFMRFLRNYQKFH